MSTNLSVNHRSGPSRHVTLNIITDKVSRFVSVTALHRQPSEAEKKAADWSPVLTRNGYTVHVIGRGDQLTVETLQALARSYVDGGSSIWVRVDLAALETGKNPVERIEPDERPAEWMDTDPVWQRIRAINAGGAL